MKGDVCMRHIFICGVLLVAIFLLPFTFNLYRKVGLKERRIAEIDTQVKVSLNLMKNTVWYVVRELEVSSQPDGKGEHVILDIPLRAIGDRLGISHPYYNTKVNFLPSVSRSGAYPVEGGWLTYQYMD